MLSSSADETTGGIIKEMTITIRDFQNDVLEDMLATSEGKENINSRNPQFLAQDPGREIFLIYATPLACAAYWGNEEAVEMLLKAGADPSLKTNELTAAEIARRRGHPKIEQLIKKRIAEFENPVNRIPQTFKPNSIQKKVFDLGIKKDYKAIEKITQSTQDFNDLKELITLQLTIALSLVDRITFDHSPDDYKAFEFKEQTIIPNTKYMDSSRRVRLQWTSLLLQSLQDVTKIQSDNPHSKGVLKTAVEKIQYLLQDLGYIYQPFPLEDMQHIKMALSKNFPLLFEPLSIMKNVKPLNDIQIMRERLDEFNQSN
jgi:hypothetical protein